MGRFKIGVLAGGTDMAVIAVIGAGEGSNFTLLCPGKLDVGWYIVCGMQKGGG